MYTYQYGYNSAQCTCNLEARCTFDVIELEELVLHIAIRSPCVDEVYIYIYTYIYINIYFVICISAPTGL